MPYPPDDPKPDDDPSFTLLRLGFPLPAEPNRTMPPSIQAMNFNERTQLCFLKYEEVEKNGPAGTDWFQGGVMEDL